MTDSDKILRDVIERLREEYGIGTVDESVEVDSEKIRYGSDTPSETENGRSHHTLCGDTALETTVDE